MRMNQINPINQQVDPFNSQSAVEAFQQRARSADQKLREHAIGTLANPQGLQLLETLTELYNNMPVCPPGSVEGYGFYREGQNSVIARLKNIVKEAQTPIPQTV